jgi:hypothetical protein
VSVLEMLRAVFLMGAEPFVDLPTAYAWAQRRYAVACGIALVLLVAIPAWMLMGAGVSPMDYTGIYLQDDPARSGFHTLFGAMAAVLALISLLRVRRAQKTAGESMDVDVAARAARQARGMFAGVGALLNVGMMGVGDWILVGGLPPFVIVMAGVALAVWGLPRREDWVGDAVVLG